LPLHPEDGSDVFFQNVGLSSTYTLLSRIPHSSVTAVKTSNPSLIAKSDFLQFLQENLIILPQIT
jgi:hypothetical protein